MIAVSLGTGMPLSVVFTSMACSPLSGLGENEMRPDPPPVIVPIDFDRPWDVTSTKVTVWLGRLVTLYRSLRVGPLPVTVAVALNVAESMAWELDVMAGE